MKVTLAILFFSFAVFVQAIPLDNDALLDDLLGMLSLPKNEQTLVTSDSSNVNADADVDIEQFEDIFLQPDSAPLRPTLLSSLSATRPSLSTPRPSPKSLPLTIYETISKENHPFSPLPQNVRQSLSSMFINRLEKVLPVRLQQSLNNATKELEARTINNRLQTILSHINTNNKDETRRNAGRLLSRLSKQEGMDDLLSNTPIMWATARNLSDDLKKTARTIQEQIRQEVPADEWLPKLRRKLARTLRLNTGARLVLMRKEIDTQLESRFLDNITKLNIIRTTIIPSLDKIVTGMLKEINEASKGKKGKKVANKSDATK
ncbi:hypothetical protein BDF19DRAFT_429959 [Syncephalis fuscata]|nr:hypothetical protein BDF19DRAFT_429959 [Syncephalis fuscata]